MTGGFFMLLLHADKISKFYGDRKIFNEFTLKLYSGDRVGVVGPNGAGKTTLLNILSGADQPDEGLVRHYTTISYVRQQDDGVPEVVSGTSLDGVDAKIAGFLKVNGDSFHKGMSGGEKARARFALSYDSQCGLLIVDEPTSNMDMEASRVIEEELLGFDGALLIVSHDRELLDKLCTSVLEVSDGTVTSYSGNYSDYVQLREAAYERQQFEYESYVKEKTRLQNRIQERVEHMNSVKKAPSRMGNSEARLNRRGYTAIQNKLNQSIDILETRLDMMEKKERPKDLPQVMMRIDPPTNPVSSRAVRARDLSMGFEGKPLVNNASFEIITGKRTALLGKNGSGKTTLAEMIYRRDKLITIAPGAEIGYFKQDFSILDENRTILENVRSDSTKPEHEIRGILARLLIAGDDVFKRVSVLSGGEKVKVSIAKVIVSKANFIILDEPTNYLDVFSMEALEKVLCDYTGTLLLISHDRRFIENVAQRLIFIENKTLTTFEGAWAEYEERKNKAGKSTENGGLINITLLQMRLAELSVRISSCGNEAHKQELEAQYLETVKQLSAQQK